MKLVYILLKTSLGRFLLGVLISAVSGILYAYSIKLLHEIIRGDQPLGAYIQIIAFITLASGLSILSGYHLTRLYEKKISDLRLSLSEKILKAKFELIEGNSLKIIPVLNNDINTIGTFIKTIPEFLVAVFKIVACFIYMFWLSTLYTSFILVIFLVIFSMTLFFLPRLHHHEQKVRGLRNDLFEHLRGLVEGIKELTLNKRHQSIYINNIVGPPSVKHSDHMTSLGTLNILITKLGELIVIVCLATAVLFLNNSGGVSEAFLIEYLTLILFVLPSLIIATNFFRNLKKVEVSLEQINELGLEFDQMKEEVHTDEEDLNTVQAVLPAISLENVQFEYRDDKNTLFTIGPVSFDLNRNEVLFLVGGNGSGKTSLGKLIAGLYTPSSGAVKYYGQPVDTRHRNAYRDKFSALFPDSYVFKSFSYISDDTFNSRGKRYVEELKIDDKVNFKDKELSKVNLSYGQQGRLSLLRVLLEDKEIYLFDEWAANQDPHFKRKFYNEIVPGLKEKGKTIIVITHDEAYFHQADKVVFMENGKIKKTLKREEMVELNLNQ